MFSATQYELQYSESRVGNLFGKCFPMEVFAYCATLTEAVNSLLRQNYNFFNNNNYNNNDNDNDNDDDDDDNNNNDNNDNNTN